jgi:hypothetical protein
MTSASSRHRSLLVEGSSVTLILKLSQLASKPRCPRDVDRRARVADVVDNRGIVRRDADRHERGHQSGK